jgi:hypothetical protein
MQINRNIWPRAVDWAKYILNTPWRSLHWIPWLKNITRVVKIYIYIDIHVRTTNPNRNLKCLSNVEIMVVMVLGETKEGITRCFQKLR